MSNNCYNCGNLDPNKKKPGRVSGNLYFCKKQNKFVNAETYGCDKHVPSNRQGYKNEEIYKDSRSYSNDTTPTWFYLIVLGVLIIIGLIMGVFTW